MYIHAPASSVVVFCSIVNISKISWLLKSYFFQEQYCMHLFCWIISNCLTLRRTVTSVSISDGGCSIFCINTSILFMPLNTPVRHSQFIWNKLQSGWIHADVTVILRLVYKLCQNKPIQLNLSGSWIRLTLYYTNTTWLEGNIVHSTTLWYL